MINNAPSPLEVVILVAIMAVCFQIGRNSERKSQEARSNSSSTPTSKLSSKSQTKAKREKRTSRKSKSPKQIETEIQDALDTPLEGCKHPKVTKERKETLSVEEEEAKGRDGTDEEETLKNAEVKSSVSPIAQALEDSGIADRIREKARPRRLLEEQKKKKRQKKELKELRLKEAEAKNREWKLQEMLEERKIEERIRQEERDEVERWMEGVEEGGKGWVEMDYRLLQEIDKAEGRFWGGFGARWRSDRVKTKRRGEEFLKRLF